MERIEPETEIHRLQKAIKHLLDQSQSQEDILFPNSRVCIQATRPVLVSPAGQLILTLMVNLLARMKSAISDVSLLVPSGILLHRCVPLYSNDFRDGLVRLVNSINGPQSIYAVKFSFDGQMDKPTVSVLVGGDHHDQSPATIRVDANAWTAYINASQSLPDWDTSIPFGPHMAATLAVAEIFKHLLIYNFPHQLGELQIKLLDDMEFSALTYGADPGASTYPSIDKSVYFDNIAIAGVGAGGSAVLYSLCCLPNLTGKIALIDPGRHKQSNLSRYLLSSYQDCHTGTHKVETAHTFLSHRHPLLEVQIECMPYAEVQNRDYRLVVSTVDTLEARWDIQHDWPPVLLDAAVVETIYAVLRVYPGRGLCLGCKHPYDSNITWTRRARMWGKSVEEVRQLDLDCTPVTQEDIIFLAQVQDQPVERFIELVGIPFNKVPALTECGDTRFNLRIPNQAATIPFVTTMAGILTAAEIVKDQYAQEMVLNNWFDHNMLWMPKLNRHQFRPRISSCQFCEKRASIK